MDFDVVTAVIIRENGQVIKLFWRRYRIRKTSKRRPIFAYRTGQGIAVMGNSKDHLTFRKNVTDDSAIFIPAGTWHNVINTDSFRLKLYAIYAPSNHPFGTIQQTKDEALSAKEYS